MRIAVPVSNDRTAETLSGIEGFQFFEDDHGRIVRRFFVPRAGEGAAAAVAQLEPYGVDALVCGALPGDERLETAAAGILLFPTFSGTPEEAALAFLGGTVARDPNNKCNACGFQFLLLAERQGRLRQDLTQKSVPHRGTLFSYSPQVRLRLPEVTSTGGLVER